MMKQKHYSIAQVSDLLGYKPYVIRYYEKVFDLKIPRDDVNRRYFTEKEILILKQIKELQKRGYNNKQIKMIINSSTSCTQQFYEQFEGIAATTCELNSFCNYEVKRPLEEGVLKQNNNILIEELNKQLKAINQNIATVISILVKITNEMSYYNEISNSFKKLDQD